METTTSKCNLCQEPAESKCSGCRTVVYCCKEHQNADWKVHKKECKPYQIMTDDLLGRHLVATRNLKPGDVVLKESPLIWGPSQVTAPVCLGCGKLLNKDNQKPCSKCGWPMCSTICQSNPVHLPECSYTVERQNKVTINTFNVVNPTYECITPLRMLYHKQFLPDIWQKLDTLQSHCEERKKTPKYENDRRMVAEFIRRFFQLNIDDDAILRICGILNVNGHEVPLSEPHSVAIYHIASLFENNCRANCSKTFTSNGEVLITVGCKPIAKGEHLSICYTDPLWGTSNRLHYLQETKFFNCKCTRCQDVTEFGTFFSCIKCLDKNCHGVATPHSFFDISSSFWKCQKCQKQFPNEQVDDLIEDLGRRLQDLQKNSVPAAKVFLSHAAKHVPGNHFYITDVKVALTELIGQEYRNALEDVSEEDLLLKIRLCKELLSLMDILAPSENRARGMLFFEIHSAIAELGKRRGATGQEGPNYLYESLVQSKKYLVQAIETLKHEPEIMPEGAVLSQAKINLTDINVLLAAVEKTVGVRPT